MHITIDQEAAGGAWKISILDYSPRGVTTAADALAAALALFAPEPPGSPTSILWMDDARVSGLQERIRALEAIVKPPVVVPIPTPAPAPPYVDADATKGLIEHG